MLTEFGGSIATALLPRRRAVPVKSYTGVRMDRGQAERQHISGVRVDGDVVVMTEEHDW